MLTLEILLHQVASSGAVYQRHETAMVNGLLNLLEQSE